MSLFTNTGTILLVLNLFTQLLASIICFAAGLIVWDIGTRSPAQVVIDAATAARTPKALLRGVVRFFIGLLFIAVSIAVLFFAVPPAEAGRYMIYQIGAVVAALAVEILIGEDVRPLLGVRRGTRTR